MGTLNTEALAPIPGAIEATQQVYLNKFPATAETITDVAKQTGAGQFIKDAQLFQQDVDKMAEMVKAVLGDEGDTLVDNGTIWAAVMAGRKTEKAMGGEA